MPYDLSISYSRRDNTQGRITQLVERIKADFALFAKRELATFFDQQEIHGMQDWRQRILQGLRESRLLLACLSPAYLQSEYCEWEFVEYLKYEIGHLHGFNGVAPIYFVEVPGWDSKEFEQQCAAWIAELRKRQHFDLRPWHDQGEEALRQTAVQERMGKLNRQIVQTITRGERAEKSLGNVDAHNPHFIGRTASLRMLRENFVTPGHIGVVTAVNGVGGLGKTALAIEYAHAFADEYGGGRWQVRCAGKDDLRLALAELATPIGFEFTDDEKKNADLQFERTRRELKRLADTRAPHRCLLLLDNVDRPGLLDPAQVARLNGGDWLHVLATTRLGENELHGAHRDRSFLAIDELPPDDALALIESYQSAGRFRSEVERDAAREIVRLLGSFTLAVESAAVYLGQFANDVTCAAFLARLNAEGLEGLDTAASQSSEGVLHGEKRLSATLQPTLERLGAAEKLALEFAALLPPDQVPLPWLRALVAKPFPEMERDAEPGHPDPWKNVLRRLFSLRLFQPTSVIDADGQPLVVRVHRVLQEVVLRRSDIPRNERRDRLIAHAGERCVFLREGSLNEANRWELTPLSGLAVQSLEREEPDALCLADEVASRLDDLGHYTEAEQLYRRGLAIKERNLGREHADTLRSANKLAVLLWREGIFSEAEALCRRTLAAFEQVRGFEHPDTLSTLSNLALILKDQGDYAKAEPIFRRVLSANERVLGPEHPSALTSVHNLANLLELKGDYSAAEPLFRRSFEARERILGPDHPDTLGSVMLLADLLMSQGDYSGAEPLLHRAWETNERILGSEHLYTLSSLNGVALLQKKRGDHAAAESLYRQVVEISQRVLPNHPDTLTFMNNLAILLTDKGDYRAAELLFRRILEGRERLLGPEHPSTLNTCFELARLLDYQGDYVAAEPLYRKAVEGRERTLLPEHPDIVGSLGEYSLLLRKLGRLAEAEPLLRRALAISEKTRGLSHPIVPHRLFNLSIVLLMQERMSEARQYLARAWQLKTSQHDITSTRILFVRLAAARLESLPVATYMGQLKTLLAGPPLEAVEVAATWDIAYFIEFLRPKLGEHHAEFLTALVAAMNERAKLPALDSFPEWRDQPPVPLDTPWPSE